MWDLGLSEASMEDPVALRKVIQYFDEYFDLVLIAERFDESLVLMRDLLCWNLEDITYLKVMNCEIITKSKSRGRC